MEDGDTSSTRGPTTARFKFAPGPRQIDDPMTTALLPFKRSTTACMTLSLTRHNGDNTHHNVDVPIPRIFKYTFHPLLRNEVDCSWCGKPAAPAWIYDVKEFWKESRFCKDCYPIIMDKVREFLGKALELSIGGAGMGCRPNMLLQEDEMAF